MRTFLFGLVAAVVLVGLAAFGAVKTGAVPARQDTPPGKLETWAAKMSLNATMAREAPTAPYPFGPPAETDFVAAASLYVQNCAVCHGTGHSSESAIGRGFAVKAPQFAKHGVDDDPEGQTYWKIEHGIRMTGMPAFDNTLDEKAIWQLTYFMKHLPELPPKAKAIFDDPRLAAPGTPVPDASNVPGAKGLGTTT
jgi:thiosulfate dehydrogenase